MMASPCLKSIWSLLRGDVNFVPVELTLSSLPNQTSRDMEPDLEKKLLSLKHNLKQVQSICQLQIGDEFIKKFSNSVSPLLRLEEFKKCIEAIDDDISCTIASKLVPFRNCGIGPDDIRDVCRDVYDAFFVDDVLTDWFSLKFLLKDISLPFHTRELELEELDIGQHVESFVRIVRVEDDLVSKLKERLCLPDGVGEEFHCFEVLTLCREEQDVFIKSLQSFCDQVFKSQCDASLIASGYMIGGTVKSLDHTDVPPPLAQALGLHHHIHQPKSPNWIAAHFWSYNCRNRSLSCVKSLSAVDELELVLARVLFPVLLPGGHSQPGRFGVQLVSGQSQKDVESHQRRRVGLQQRRVGSADVVKLEKDLQGLRLKARSLLEKMTGGSRVADYVEKFKVGAKDACGIDTLDQLMNSPEDGDGRH